MTQESANDRLRPLTRLRADSFESPVILKKLATASRRLAELKGLAASIPSQEILSNALALQEAKDSSAIENIVTTHDELFRSDDDATADNSPAAKEVRHYVRALHTGFELVRTTGLLTANHLITIQGALEQNKPGFRKLPGTTLRDGSGRVVYTPPQRADEIVALMSDLERFVNDDDAFKIDPLLKMAIAHHQFESIHPFYDGNGRTGRILNVLYLVNKELLDIPILYISSHIVRTKPDYYRLLQSVRTSGDSHEAWQEWVLYILTAVEETAQHTIATVGLIRDAFNDYKQRIRSAHKFYNHELINNLFMHPYTKIEFVERELDVSRITATKYLELLVEGGFLRKIRVGRNNYYINVALNGILTREFGAE